MFSDPIFLAALIGVVISLIIWGQAAIKLNGDSSEALEVPNQAMMSKIGFALGIVILYRVFINAGDLSIILLLGSIVTLIIWSIGQFANNKYLKTSGRSWFIPKQNEIKNY